MNPSLHVCTADARRLLQAGCSLAWLENYLDLQENLIRIRCQKNPPGDSKGLGGHRRWLTRLRNLFTALH